MNDNIKLSCVIFKNKILMQLDEEIMDALDNDSIERVVTLQKIRYNIERSDNGTDNTFRQIQSTRS